MKSGWAIKKLGEVCEVVLGGTPKTSVTAYWGGSIPWLTPGDMGKMIGPYVERTSRSLTQKGLENGSTLFPARSVILSTRAPIGYTFINRVPMSTNQGCKTLVPTADVWPEFLYYNLLGRTQELNDLGTGTTFKELATGALKEMEISIPPLAEQKRIVAKIDAAFERIDKLKANAERNLANAKELFQSALDEAMRPKKGWVEKEVNEVVDIVTPPCKLPARLYKPAGAYPIVSQDADLISGYSDKREAVIKVEEPLVIFGDHTKAIKYVDFDFIQGADGVKILSVRKDVLPKFFYYAIRRLPLRSLGYARHYKLLKASVLSYPLSATEQRQIVNRLDVLAEKTKSLEQHYTRQIADCAEMRQSVLREAFEGRL